LLTIWLLHARTWFSDVGVVMTSRVQKRVLWQQRLADLEASGMTQAAYCVAQGIGYSTLQRWQRRLRREAATGAVVQADAAPGAGLGLIPIRVREVPGSRKDLAPAPPELALTWPGGLRLQLPVATDAGWLADLLRGLGC
jgi:hypothetical protein